MKRFLLISFVAACSLLFCGCNYNRNIEQIARAESYIADSAQLSLRILDSVNRRSLILPKHIAHFSLLYAEAQAKCRCDALDSATVSCAYNYFKHNGNPTQKLHANYLMGYFYQLRGDNSGAMYYYTCGEEFVEQCDNDFLCGRLYSFMGGLYERNYNFSKSLDCFKLSYDYYSKTDFELHTYCALCSVASSLQRLGRYDEAEPLLLECIEWAYKTKPELECDDFIYQLLFLYIHTEQHAKLQKLLDSDYMSMYVDDYLKYVAMSCCADHDGKFDVALSYLNQALSKCKSRAESAVVLYNLYQLNQKYGRQEEAMKYIVQYQKNDRGILLSKLSSPILDSTIDYYKERSMIEQERLMYSRYKIWVLIIVVAVLAIFIAYIVILKRSQYLLKLNDIITQFELQERELLEQNLTLEKNKNFLLDQNYQLLKGRFEYVEQISKALYEKSKKLSSTTIVFNKISSILDNIKISPSENSEIERNVNGVYNNIMVRAREQLPKFQEDDFKLMCYTYAGFSTGAICYLINIETTQIAYQRRSRLVERIKRVNPRDCDEFIARLKKPADFQ